MRKKKAGETRLNKEQIEAIKYGHGPLLIIAGAGTGKTTVITERIKYLILSQKTKPNEVLALTFTEKAAREMEERVDVAMPYGYTQMWISTFHSFCDRVLRAEALQIGFDPKYKLMTEAETVQFIRNNLFKFDLNYFRPLGNPTKFVGGMLQHFSRLQDEDVSPNDYLTWAEKQKSKTKTKEDKAEIAKWIELAKSFKTYDELKVKEGLMDFGDLIVKTLVLFRQRPNILKQYQKQFKYVLVDEYQDTNIAQNELVKLLVGKKGNPTVVLDDDQSIYRFRGAAISNALQFRKSFPKAKVISLTKNYRSTQEILDRAYELIQHNNPDRLEAVEKIEKRLVSQKEKDGEEVKFIHTDRVENEADSIAKKIKELTDEGYDFGDIAILVRANNHSEPFIRALARHGIPYQFLGPGRLFKQEEIIDLISYLKVLYNFEDSVALYRLLSIDYFDIPARDLAAIGNYARRFNLTLFESCEKIANIFVSSETREKVKKIMEIIGKHLKLIRRETAGQLLYYFLEDTGLLTKMLSPDSPEAEKKAANISKFFDKLKTYEVDHQDATVPAVVDWLELSSELGESPRAADTDWTEVDAVNILTAHSSKGLEFPVVFLVNLVAQRFPTTERREQIPIPDALIKEVLPIGDYHLEEERRLFYVGMTRARERVFVTAADYYGEGKREKRLSPFIFEALGNNAVASELSEVAHKQLTFLDYAAPKILEAKYQIAKLHIDYLSFSQIETFRICPLHYKLKYIYKIPTPPSSSQSFGNSFHQTMKAFYETVMKGKKPSEALMSKVLEENWISEGYLGKRHESSSFEKAKKFLRHYLKNTFNPKAIPTAMEQPFLVKLGGLKVGGKMDRLDVHGDTLEIIDYKTGAKPLSQKEADSDLQLSIYALAATSIPELPFARVPEKVKLSLYYFDTPQIVSTTRTKAQLEDAEKMIEDYKNQIEKSDFNCSGGILCRNCEYSFLCRAQV
ncbi:UvrD-helicase domain-containing protein [Candidatus Woesebacteria bacterium]|nr:UvrD-helicase domain-containing protein [Candidatus Woesebacteria bacterium]